MNSSFINGDVVLCPRDMLSNNELPNKRRERQSEALITAIRSPHEDPEPVEHVQSVTRGIGNETVQKITSLLLRKIIPEILTLFYGLSDLLIDSQQARQTN